MKITHVIGQILRIENVEAKTAGTQDTLLIRIRTDQGLEGIGESDASPEVLKAIVDAPYSHNIACGLRELLVGENPLDTDRLWAKMYRRTMYFGRRAVGIAAMAGVDLALWDTSRGMFLIRVLFHGLCLAICRIAPCQLVWQERKVAGYADD